MPFETLLGPLVLGRAMALTPCNQALCHTPLLFPPSAPSLTKIQQVRVQQKVTCCLLAHLDGARPIGLFHLCRPTGAQGRWVKA